MNKLLSVLGFSERNVTEVEYLLNLSATCEINIDAQMIVNNLKLYNYDSELLVPIVIKEIIVNKIIDKLVLDLNFKEEDRPLILDKILKINFGGLSYKEIKITFLR